MKKLLTFALIFATCLLVACDQDCPMTGSPDTTYSYAYNTPDGIIHFGDVTTNENGNGIIGDVPSDVDCGKVQLRQEIPTLDTVPPPVA
jgi:hypothetical protein